MELKDKLYGFPKIYCISLDTCIKRRNIVIEQFLQHDITNINFNIVKPWGIAQEWWTPENDFYSHTLCDVGKSIVANQLKNISKWLTTTNDKYAFFCEDDVSLETVQCWNFSWLEFINTLPKDWECVQLQIVRTCNRYPLTEVKLHPRNWYDWGATAFIIKREYGERLINTHLLPGGIFNFTSQIQEPFIDPENVISPDLHRCPYPEHIIYGSATKVYSIPLFVENVSLATTKCARLLLESGQSPGHHESYISIKNWWSTNLQHTLNDILL